MVTHNAVKIQLAGTRQVHVRATDFTVDHYRSGYHHKQHWGSETVYYFNISLKRLST